MINRLHHLSDLELLVCTLLHISERLFITILIIPMIKPPKCYIRNAAIH